MQQMDKEMGVGSIAGPCKANYADTQHGAHSFGDSCVLRWAQTHAHALVFTHLSVLPTVLLPVVIWY